MCLTRVQIWLVRTGSEHHSEEEPANEEHVYSVPRFSSLRGERSDDDADETDLEEQGVPLEPQEGLADPKEGLVEHPHEEEGWFDAKPK